MPRKELPLFYQEMKKKNPEKYIAFLEKENLSLIETIEAYRQAMQDEWRNKAKEHKSKEAAND